MTDTVTVSRELLRQVLEAVNSYPHRHLTPSIAATRVALRAALEQPAPVQEPSDSDYATIAGLDASIGHLSRLVDEQRKLLVRCADVFGVDRFGIPFEDGDSELIDRVREMVATTTSPTAIQWPKARDVGRYGDMSQEAHMRVGLDSDNDVFVSVWDGAGGAT